MCWEGYFCVCVCVCLSFSFRVFCFCRFMFWCIVRFSSFDCVFAFFVFFFFSFCVCVFCFQFSLPITKYFVCLFVFAYNWMFCLRALALVRLNKSVVLWVIFVCLLCGWCLLLWPSLSFSQLTLMRSLLVFLCVFVWCGCCCLLILSHLNIWINVLDFLHCFSMILFLFAVLLRVQEFKSFSILFLSFHLFLSLSMLLLF